MILGPDSFRAMPWANGKGLTLEMLRIEAPEGLVLRLSRASVVEAGAFSIFPGIERNLTVLTGPGFDLIGLGISVQARPLRPVAFAGDVPVQAVNVAGPSDDFNVMTARSLPVPEVRLLLTGDAIAGPALFLYALGKARVSGRDVPDGALLMSRAHAELQVGGPVLAVAVTGLDEGQMRKIG